MADREFYAGQSRVTDPGPFADRLAEVPGDLPSLRAAARQLVFHYRADGDWAENGIAPDRLGEIDLRYARDMLARLVELADQPLTRDRTPAQRMVGCCRDFTVLFVALARQHGFAARARVGFATYFRPGWSLDHVVAEVWDAVRQRWRLIDAELDVGHVDPSDGVPVDPLDLPASRFLTAPVAWQACRSGAADVSRFVVAPELDVPVTRGWPQVRHNLLHDLAALTKHEMVLWDDWGLADGGESTVEQLALLDSLAAAISAGDPPLEEIESFSRRDGLGVPPVVNSYSPASPAPLRVRV
jgi:Transglutaminase-like superfamily